jgi:hypothetical protein
MKIRSLGADFHSDGLTDMTKLIAAFRNFTNPPNKILPERHCCHMRCK